jgi:hypothetical protein
MNPGRWIPVALSLVLCGPAFAQTRVEIVADEAEAVLAILSLRAEGKAPGEADWKRLFQSEGYRRLVAREASFKHTVDEAAFKDFVLGKELLAKAPELARTLRSWRSADMERCGRRALDYLPEGAAITARVYPVIKPWKNSFVFEGKAIFLYLDPAKTQAQFENTLVHELHHIGLESVPPEPATRAALDKLPPDPLMANRWVSAFGEGFAMLAAAGGPDVHPHASSPVEDRQRWDRDMARFDADLKQVEAFLLDVAEGRLKGEAMQAKGMDFFGIQGPWYTVGWRMASSIEKVLGRPALLACMRDPRRLLPTFNEAVAKGRLPYATWSPRLLAVLGGE